MAEYADIVEVELPEKAARGFPVTVTVGIKNLYSGTIGIMVGGALEYGPVPWPSINFPENWANIPAGQVHRFTGQFIMPESDATVHIYSYWYGEGTWHLDDEETRRIKVTEVVYDFVIGYPGVVPV